MLISSGPQESGIFLNNATWDFGGTPYFRITQTEIVADTEVACLERALRPDFGMASMQPATCRHAQHEMKTLRQELAMQYEKLMLTQMKLEEFQSRYFDLYAQAPVGYFTLLNTDRIVEANLMAASMFGLPHEVLLGQSFFPYVQKCARDVWHINRKRLLETGERQVFDLRMVDSKENPFWGHLSMTLSSRSAERRGPAGEPRRENPDIAKESVEAFHCLVVMVDVSERKKLEAELALEKNLLETTLGSIGDGVISTDSVGNVAFMNRVAESMTGWSRDNAKGKPLQDVFHLVNECTNLVRDAHVEQILANGKMRSLPAHTVLISRSGEAYSIEDNAAPILGDDGEIIGVVIGFRDSSEKRKKLEEIKYLSYHDQLTGLYNRRFFEEELQRLDTARNLPISIIMGDVNGLKLINDSFGHATGDELLRQVADAIRMGCRADEIVARLGGDEFVIVLPGTSVQVAETIVRRIRENAANRKVGSVDISISFGTATKTNEAQHIQEVFRDTENRMYRQKLSESSSIRSKTIHVIMNSLFEKNHREMRHSERVGKLSFDIASALNLNEEDISQIRIAGLMHDIGKIGIDETILNKPGKLDDVEWKEMQRHAEIGYRILSSVNEFSEIADYILEHHEKWNGDGYPKGLQREAISLQARIITVADAFDAMTGARPYGKPMNATEAVQEIIRCSGTQFDPSVARVFVEKVLGMAWVTTEHLEQSQPMEGKHGYESI